VGLIAPYAQGFCETCNRVRVTAAGAFRSCLFGKREVPLRHLLGSGVSRPELVALLAASIWAKPAAHHLRDGDAGATRTLAVIGG
jgi:cyclic pyranopterin phosphate synthase